MAKLLSDNTAARMLRAISATENSAPVSKGRLRRRIRTGGAGSVRSYVRITEVIDAANYIGNVLEGPDDDTVTDEGVIIRVDGAKSNPFGVDYSAFADGGSAEIDDVQTTVFYLDGYLLG